jgi:sulfur transfer complex TusBCD TusB component (DsrH family)
MVLMSDYLLVQTQGRWSGPAASRFVADAARLAGAGHRVVLLLVQDGVDAALGSQPDLDASVLAGVEVWADEFSLAQRALGAGDLARGVAEVAMAKVVDVLVEPGVRVVWH